MPRVLLNPAAPRGTPDWKPLSPICDNLKDLKALMRFIVACLIISEKRRNHTKFVSTYLEWYANCLDLICSEDNVFCQSMRVFVGYQSPTGEMIIQKCVSLIKKYIASKPPKYELGVWIHDNFADKTGNAHFHTDHPHWESTFQHVWEHMFPSEMNGVHVDQSFYVLMNSSDRNQALSVSSHAAIVTRTAVTNPQPFVPAPLTHRLHALVQSNRKPVVPAFVPISQQSASPPVSEPVRTDPPLRDDGMDLILSTVKEALESCVDNAVTLAAKSFDAGNCSNVMESTDYELDARVLATKVTSAANEQALEAIAVTAAADGGETVQRDMPSSVEFVPGDSEAARLFLEIAGESDSQFHENGAGGPLSVIHEEDGADQSGTSSPLPDGERRAPFTTFAQSPPQGVEDGALIAHPLLLADSLESANAPKSSSSNLGSNLSSGPSGKPSTHELSSMLLAASMPSSPQSAFTPAATTSADGSPLAQSSSKQLEPAPQPPLKTDVVRWKMNGGGAQSSGNPIGNPPGIVQSNVDARWNPRADQPSSASQGKVRGPQVQVLAQSGDPPGNSGGADHHKTLSSSKLWSDSSKVRTNPHASLLKSKFSSPKERNGIGGSNPVAHSSDNPSVSASTIPPLSKTVVLPAGRTGIGGSQGAQFQADRLVNAPPPAPSLSPELGSAATPAAPPNEKPSTLWGVDIGGGEHNRVGTQFVELAFRILMMKYSKSLPDPLPTWTPPCVPNVPFLVARQARVA